VFDSAFLVILLIKKETKKSVFLMII
jgi:hypothetical protein